MQEKEDGCFVKIIRWMSTIGGLMFVGTIIYLNPMHIVRHEKACAAVARYRKDTGTAGVIKLRDEHISLTEQQEVAGETVGPWLDDAETNIFLKENGDVVVSVGKVSYPCAFKLSTQK